MIYFLVIALLHTVASQEWQLVSKFSTKVPSGYHYFDLVDKSAKNINIEVQYENSPIVDFEIYLYSKQGDIFSSYQAIESAVSIFNPQTLSANIQSQQGIYVKIENYYRQSASYNLTIKLDDQILVDHETFFYIPGVDSKQSTYTLWPAQTPGCKYKGKYRIEVADSIMTVTQSGSLSLLHLQEIKNPFEYQQVGFQANQKNKIEFKITMPLSYPSDPPQFYDFQLDLYKIKGNYLWDNSSKSCFFDCYTLPHSKSFSIQYYPKCVCEPGYTYNSVNNYCEFSCTNMKFTKAGSQLGNSSCQCFEGFYWDGYKCLLDCSKIENAMENNKNREDACICEQNYKWLQTPLRCVEDGKERRQTFLYIIYGQIAFLIVMIILIIGCCIWKRNASNIVANLDNRRKLVDESREKMERQAGSDENRSRKQIEELQSNSSH